MSHKRTLTPLGDFAFESIADDGSTIFRCPGGSAIELSIPAELVRYYRRLVPQQKKPKRERS